MRVWPIAALIVCLGFAGFAAVGDEPAGHKRMVAELRKLSEAAQSENPFLGRGSLVDARRRLAALPAERIDAQRWAVQFEIGKELLRLGETEAAIEHLTDARGMLAKLEGAPAEVRVMTTFELALAYMRQGENLNCTRNHTAESCILPIRGGGVHIDRSASEQAQKLLIEVLRAAPQTDPHYLRARWLLNIATMTLGQWPDAVPQPWRIGPDTFASDQPFPRFTDVAPQSGLATFDLAGGAIVEDFNGDGRLDVMVSTNDPAGQVRVYLNRGQAEFAETTKAAGLAGITGGLNMTAADYDNDGDVDVLVLRGGWWKSYGRHPNSLLRNNGDATFTDVTYAAGLGDSAYPTQTAAWADYDNDGDLDVFIGNEHSPEQSAPSQLFRNNGDGTFTDVALQAGVTNLAYAKGSAWGDIDGDRFPDLFVSNLGSLNRLYYNNGDGTFHDIASTAGVGQPVSSFATWFWDYDNDGNLDLFVATYGGPQTGADVASVAASYLGLPHRAELDQLYRGDGRGGFTAVGREMGLTRVTLPMGANYGDLDNDGYLDFYLGTGYPQFEALTPNVMFRNRAGRGFADVTTDGGFGHLQKGHGVVFADLDDDGDQDIYEQIGGQFPGDKFGNVLFENPGFGNRWLKLRLIGAGSNRSAIGARIRVDVVENGTTRSIHRVVSTGGSFGVNPLRAEIGLGSATTVRTIEVFWPTSGRRQRFENIAVDRFYEIREDAEELRPRDLQPFTLQQP